MPGDDDIERETGPLGSELDDPAADGETDGGPGGPADGVAGPGYPPEETEPDAR